MKYAIKVERTSYVCKGSFVYQGSPYKVIGRLEDARLFKSRKAAQNELDRMQGKFENIDMNCEVVEVDL